MPYSNAYTGSAGSSSVNGGTFTQSTVGCIGPWADASVRIDITDGFNAHFALISGNAYVKVNGSIVYSFPFSYTKDGNNTYKVSFTHDFGPGAGPDLTGKSVQGLVSTTPFGDAAVVTLTLTPSNPFPPPTPPGGAAPGGFSGPLGLLFGLSPIGPVPTGSPSAAPAAPDPADPSTPPDPYTDNPPSYPPDPLGWPGASFSGFRIGTRGGLSPASDPASASVRKAAETAAKGKPLMQCLKLKSRNYVNTTPITLPINLPIAIQIDNSQSVTAKWLKVSPGLYNQAAAAGNSKLGIRIYRGLVLAGAANKWVPSPTTGFGVAPEWVGVASYPDLIPWDGTSQFVIELTGSDATIPTGSFFELVVEGFDT